MCFAGIEFEAGWKGLKDGHSRSAYLGLIHPPLLPTLLKCSLTSPLLYDILTTALQYTSKEDSAHAAAVLQHLSKVRLCGCSPLMQDSPLGCYTLLPEEELLVHVWKSTAINLLSCKLRGMRNRTHCRRVYNGELLLQVADSALTAWQCPES